MISTRLILGYLYEADSNIKSTNQSELWISGLLCWVNERYPCIENSLSSYLNGWVRWVYSRRVVSGSGINHWKNSSFLHMTQSFIYSSLSAKGKPLAILIVQTCSDPACLWRKMVSAQTLCSFYCLKKCVDLDNILRIWWWHQAFMTTAYYVKINGRCHAVHDRGEPPYTNYTNRLRKFNVPFVLKKHNLDWWYKIEYYCFPSGIYCCNLWA